jgi:mRNA interferase RelE/StbE
MAYRLEFLKHALEDWEALDAPIKTTFKKLLEKRLITEHGPTDALQGTLKGHYRITLRNQGYRLIYAVIDKAIVVVLIAVRTGADGSMREARAQARER